MATKYTFVCNDEFARSKITIEAETHSLTELIALFEDFLRASRFSFDGHLDIVEDNAEMPSDVNDVFGKMNSQRQFYTMPSTTIPNAQDDFAKWLYLNPKTCKEDQDFCLKYEDIRAKRPVMYNPNQNPVDTKR